MKGLGEILGAVVRYREDGLKTVTPLEMSVHIRGGRGNSDSCGDRCGGYWVVWEETVGDADAMDDEGGKKSGTEIKEELKVVGDAVSNGESMRDGTAVCPADGEPIAGSPGVTRRHIEARVCTGDGKS